MAKSFGHCRTHLVGRTTDTPEVKYLNERCLVKFSVAWNSFNGTPNFIKCTLWGVLGENFMKFSPTKGMVVCLDGDIQINKYEDREGKSRTETLLNVKDFTWLPQRESAQNGNNDEEDGDDGNEIESQSQTKSKASQAVAEDDIPF